MQRETKIALICILVLHYKCRGGVGLTSFDNFFSIWWQVESSRKGGYVTPGGAKTPDFKCRVTRMIEGCSCVWNVLFPNVLGRIIWQVFFWVVWFKCRDLASGSGALYKSTWVLGLTQQALLGIGNFAPSCMTSNLKNSTESRFLSAKY